MKNKLIKGLFCFGLMFMLLGTVAYAQSGSIDSVEEESNFTSAEVTIGNVEVPVYQAAIIWQDLTFDWAYNDEIKAYEWRKPKECLRYYVTDASVIEQDIQNGIKIYSDSSCQYKIHEYQETYTELYYLYDTNESTIGIEDLSQKGQIVPTITWQSSDKYSHVIGILTYGVTEAVCSSVTSEEMFEHAMENDVTLYNNSECLTEVVDNNLEYSENSYYAFINTVEIRQAVGELPDSARKSEAGVIDEYRFTEIEAEYPYPKFTYGVSLTLKNDPEKEAITPVAGEVLGTVTVSIRAK